MFFMLPVTSLLLLPLFVIAVPAALVVWWASRRRHCRRDAAPVAARRGARAGSALMWAMVVLVGALLLLGVLRSRRRHEPAAEVVRQAPVAHVELAPPPRALEVPGDGPGSAWLPEVESSFEASLYPSTTTAARAVGHRVAARLGEVVADGAPSLIRIGGSDADGAGMVRRQVAEVLRERVDEARVVLAATPPTTPAEAPGPTGVSVEVALEVGRDADPGRIVATLVGPRNSAFCEVRFIDKPWVADFDAYRSRPAGREHVLGRSASFASSAAQAERAAMTDAARRLAPLVADRLRARYGSARIRKGPDELAQGILTAMQSEQPVVDRFVQRLHRPYGDVWRAAVLADASTIAVRRHAHRALTAVAATRKAALGTWASLLGLVVLVCLLYLALSAATKGYYDRPLRVLLSLIAVAGIVLLLRG